MDLNELYLGPKLLIDVSTLHNNVYVHQLQRNYLILHQIHIFENFRVFLISWSIEKLNVESFFLCLWLNAKRPIFFNFSNLSDKIIFNLSVLLTYFYHQYFSQNMRQSWHWYLWIWRTQQQWYVSQSKCCCCCYCCCYCYCFCYCYCCCYCYCHQLYHGCYCCIPFTYSYCYYELFLFVLLLFFISLLSLLLLLSSI